MTGQRFWQVEVSGIGQDSDSHLDALHTQEGNTVAAGQEHWRQKQGRDNAKGSEIQLKLKKTL